MAEGRADDPPAQEKGSGPQHPSQPPRRRTRRATLRRRGSKTDPQRAAGRRFDLAPAANPIVIAVAAAATVPLEFRFARAENQYTVDGPLYVRILDGAGALLHEFELAAASQPGVFRTALGLPAGACQVAATTLWNATGSATFQVPAAGTIDPVRITLAR